MGAVTFERNAVGNLSGVLAVSGKEDNWIKFRGQNDAVSASIELDNGTTQKTFVITPDANSDFYFNVKEAVMSFFSNSIDDYDYSSNETNPSDLVQSIDFNVTISHSSSPNDTGTVSGKFLKGKVTKPESIFIQQERKLTDKSVRFLGYPFDVTEIDSLGEVKRILISNGGEIAVPFNLDLSSENYTLDVSGKETDITGIHFKDDGTKMYVLGTSSDQIHEYDLSSAWDLSTAIFSHSETIATNPQDIFITPDGTEIHVLLDFGGSSLNIRRYTLSTAWDLSTINSGILVNQANLGAYDGDFDSFDGLTYIDDGTKLIVVGTVSGLGNPDSAALVYTLTVAYNAAAAFSNLVSVDIDDASDYNQEAPRSIYKPPGNDFIYLVGTNNAELIKIDFTSDTFGAVSQVLSGGGRGLFISDDGFRIYRANADEIVELTISLANVPSVDESIDEECGTYLKWLNNYGGYSYFLFSSVQIDRHQIRSKGQTQNIEIDQPNNPYLELEKDQTRRRSLEGTAPDKETVSLFKSLIDSSEVYLYTGEKDEIADASKWMTVKLIDGSYSFPNKIEAIQFRFQIELP